MCFYLEANIDEPVQTIAKENKNFSLESLPPELLTLIFSFLGPQDLCRCAQVNHVWSEVAFTGSLWTTLHPTRWGNGDWRFGSELSSDDCNCDCEPNYDLLTFRE